MFTALARNALLEHLMEYTVIIDKDVCMSSGRCVLDEPDAFRSDADQLAEPIAGAAPLPADRIRAVVGACPSGAIRLYRGDREIPVRLARFRLPAESGPRRLFGQPFGRLLGRQSADLFHQPGDGVHVNAVVPPEIAHFAR
jgi:ferredoxin